MIRKCKSCGEEKEMARYQKVGRGKFYFRKHCSVCWSAEREDHQREYRKKNIIKLKASDAAKYEKNKDKLNANARRYYRKLQQQVFDHYGNACACCGNTEKNFLTLDHKNNDGASHRRKIGIGHIFYRWIIDNAYP